MKQKATVYTQLGEVDTIKEDFTEHVKNLQTTQATLQAEKTWFEIENQKLQQNLKTTTELHEEKRMILLHEIHGRGSLPARNRKETFPSTRKDQPRS
jgi:regulator of replication initiation timing